MSESEGVSCAVLFLTCPHEHGRRLVEEVRGRFPDKHWTVYLRDDHREALGDLLHGTELHRDKPQGSRLRFLWAIRRRGYDLGVMAWEGNAAYNRMKLVGLLCGAKVKVVYNENLDSFELKWGNDPVWLHHAKWRLKSGRRRPGVLPFQNLLRIYTWTIGLAIGALRLWWRHVCHQARRSLSSRGGA